MNALQYDPQGLAHPDTHQAGVTVIYLTAGFVT
jgi:hypothetical protein